MRVESLDGSVLRGFVFGAAVDINPWSEALYQIIVREHNRGTISWTNLTASELRDLENILFTRVPLSRSAKTIDELVSNLIQGADRLQFGQLRFLEDLIRVCYSPEGNQSDQSCRAQIPIPLPPLTLTNSAFVTVNGVTQSSNTVSITISFP